jgi:hypothetical protein
MDCLQTSNFHNPRTLVSCASALLPALGATDSGPASSPGVADGLAPSDVQIIPPDGRNIYNIPDCTLWTVVPSPNGGAINDQLAAVTAISASDAWAVGWYVAGDATLTLVEHWNGTSWTIVPSPHVDTFSVLYGITAVASNDVWAVGYSSHNGTPADTTLVLHWHGTNWTVVPSPNPGAYNRLYEVRAVGANNVWAVGIRNNCYGCPGQTLIEHWDGTAWTVISSPNVGYDSALYGMAVVNSNDVWAGGISHACGQTNCPSMTLTMRWNGSAWTVVPSPNAPSGFNYINRMSAVPGSTSVWAVGYYYQQGYSPPALTLALYWNGSQWSIIPTPNGQTGSSSFGGVAAVSAQNVWAVGQTNDTGSLSQSMVQHWDGTSWTIFSSQSPGAGKNELNYVAATSTGNLWTVGGYFNTPYNYRTLIERPDYTCGTK